MTVERRTIDELITRWELAGLRDIYVEGESDQQIFRTLHGKGYIDIRPDVDWIPIDVVDVPSSMVLECGLPSGSNKYRLVALARKLEQCNRESGHGVVDRDMDAIDSLDFEGDSLTYSDFASIEWYFWTPDSLEHILLEFKCNADAVALFSSIESVVRTMSAIRRINSKMDEATKFKVRPPSDSVSFSNGTAEFDLNKYISKLSIRSEVANRIRSSIDSTISSFNGRKTSSFSSGHDLMDVLVAALRQLGGVPARLIDQDRVLWALLAASAPATDWRAQRLFIRLQGWQASSQR